MAQILDYSAGYPDAAAVRDAGFEGVIRYLRKEGASSVRPITSGELADMRAHGRTVALVYQHVTKSRPTQGRAAGRHDADWALARAREIGIADPFIYMAVDFDADPASVHEYFLGAGDVLGVARLGGYGGFRVLARLFDDGLISKGWQTAAWSYGRREGRAHLYQRIGQVTVGGISCDVNDVLRPDYGQTGGGSDMGGEIADLVFTRAQNRLNEAGIVPDVHDYILVDRALDVIAIRATVGRLEAKQDALARELSDDEANIVAAVREGAGGDPALIAAHLAPLLLDGGLVARLSDEDAARLADVVNDDADRRAAARANTPVPDATT